MAFMVLCGNCGTTVKFTEGTNIALSPITLYNTGLVCNCGNEIEVNNAHVVKDVSLAVRGAQ